MRRRAFGRKWNRSRNRITRNIHLRSKIEKLSPLLDETTLRAITYVMIIVKKISLLSIQCIYSNFSTVRKWNIANEFNRVVFRIQFLDSFENWKNSRYYKFYANKFTHNLTNKYRTSTVHIFPIFKFEYFNFS